MVLRLLRMPLLIGAVTLAMHFAPTGSDPAYGRERAPYDLFYNFYVPPGPYGGLGAEMYPCPRPTPPFVGHTWITYQPFMPHEFLHHHCRWYRHHHPDGSRTKTFVIWK